MQSKSSAVVIVWIVVFNMAAVGIMTSSSRRREPVVCHVSEEQLPGTEVVCGDRGGDDNRTDWRVQRQTSSSSSSRYSIVDDDDVDRRRLFRIDEMTGILTTAVKLDREQVSEFKTPVYELSLRKHESDSRQETITVRIMPCGRNLNRRRIVVTTILFAGETFTVK